MKITCFTPTNGNMLQVEHLGTSIISYLAVMIRALVNFKVIFPSNIVINGPFCHDAIRKCAGRRWLLAID